MPPARVDLSRRRHTLVRLSHDRSDPDSSPSSTPPRSRGRTAPARPSFRKPRLARAAASWSRTRGRYACRSTELHRSCDRAPRTHPSPPSVGFHAVPMSSRFLKKSFVSAPVCWVNTPCLVCPTFAPSTRSPPHEHRHLRRRQRQLLRLVDQQHFSRNGIPRLLVVAEAIRNRLQHGE